MLKLLLCHCSSALKFPFGFLYIILDSLAAICCDRDDSLLFACIFFFALSSVFVIFFSHLVFRSGCSYQMCQFLINWGGDVVGCAMVLGKRPVSGRLTNLDNIRARAFCNCSRCGWGLFGRFVSRLSFLSSVSLFSGDDPI